MKKLLLVVAALLLLSSPAFADTFVNGGFESGDWTGWTRANGYWYGGNSYNPVGSDLGKSAIVTTGYDFYTNNNLQTVLTGNYSARINNYDNNYHYSSISQRVNNWQDDYIYFAWAAVLEEPESGNYHGADAPHFSLTLTDLNTTSQLYSMSFNAYSASAGGQPLNWLNGYNAYPGYSSQWKYIDWQAIGLDTSDVTGHDLELMLLASDCAWSGHGGYAYLDGFGATKPPVGAVPEPATMLLFGIGLAGLAARGKKKKVA